MTTTTEAPQQIAKTPRPAESAPAPHRKPRHVASTIIGGYLPLIIATLIIALPLIWMVIGSIKSPGELLDRNLSILPKDPSLDAYSAASEIVDFPRSFMNSTIVTVIGSAIKVLLALTTAYALVFVRFPFKGVFFGIILVALMVPAQVSIVPNYVLIASLGGRNTFWGIILPGLGTAFGTFLLRQQFRALPPELLEAAEMDGAGHFRRLVQIIIPVTAPTIATVALVTIVNEWNDYLWPLLIANDPEMATLPVALTLLRNSEGNAAVYPMLMAGAVIVIVPVLILFSFLQRFIVAGLTQGAVK